MASEINRLQREYDALCAESTRKFGGKARIQIEKQLRDEMKKKLDAAGGDEVAFKKKKGDAFRDLNAAKEKRLAEIVAAVASGKLSADSAAEEITALGWQRGFAQAAITRAMKTDSSAIETLAVREEPEPEIPDEIMDPVGAAQPVAREEVFAEPGRDLEPEDNTTRKGSKK